MQAEGFFEENKETPTMHNFYLNLTTLNIN